MTEAKVGINKVVPQYTLDVSGSGNFTDGLTITGSIGLTGRIKSGGSLILQPDATDVRYLEIYNTSPTDTHITASGGQIFLGDDVTYVKVDNYGSVKHIDIVADNGTNISGSVQITGSLDVSGSVGIATVLHIAESNPLPAGNIGDLAVSASHLWFYNGAWSQLD